MLPPTIPTSFVPHPGAAAARKQSADFGGALGYFAYGALGIVFLLGIGVFLYGRILDASLASKDEDLSAAIQQIDPATVQGFVRLRDRLASSEALLNGHIAFTGFFGLVEELLPTTVRFTTLHLSTTDGKEMRFDGAGVAASFNALAAVSEAFAKDGRVKDAIFSNIVVNKDSSVSFVISAQLDPGLVAYTP